MSYYNPLILFNKPVTGTPSNLLGSSSDFSGWGNTALTLTTGQTSYDGSSNATKIAATAVSSKHLLSKTITKSGSNSYTLTLYIKADGLDGVILDAESAAGNGVYTTYNYSTAAILDQGAFGIGYTIGTPTITSDLNGYYKIVLPYTSDTQTDMTIYILLYTGGGTSTFTGDGTSGVLIANATLL